MRKKSRRVVCGAHPISSVKQTRNVKGWVSSQCTALITRGSMPAYRSWTLVGGSERADRLGHCEMEETYVLPALCSSGTIGVPKTRIGPSKRDMSDRTKRKSYILTGYPKVLVPTVCSLTSHSAFINFLDEERKRKSRR